MTIILGIDPGSRVTGYGVIQTDGQRHRYLGSGCVRVTVTKTAERLQQIFSGLVEVIQHYQPHEAAIEQVFMHQNANSAIKLGQARGVAMVAVTNHTIPIAEYSARAVKQAVVGYGAATKEQVQQMIKKILNLNGVPASDAADALAMAICHANTQQLSRRLKLIEAAV